MNDIVFDLGIYEKKFILEAIADYSSLCKIAVASKNDLLICKFSNFRYSAEQTLLEFGNYVIDLMNCR